MTIDMTKPQFEHDCEACIFLGVYGRRDLYFCPDEPTVIVRASSEGPDYSSGWNAGSYIEPNDYHYEAIMRSVPVIDRLLRERVMAMDVQGAHRYLKLWREAKKALGEESL